MVPRMPAPRVAPVVSAGLFWTVTSQPGSAPTISTVSLQFSSLPSQGGTGSVGGAVLDGDVAAGVGADDLDGE